MRSDLQLREYYWTAEQTEVATDVAFRSEKALKPLYRRMLRHAVENLSSADVMRFLQQRLTKTGNIHGGFRGEIVSDLKTRPEGTRVKHRLGSNSVKMYDKFGVVLRVETTIHEAEGLKVYRPKENDPEQKLAWRPLRRGGGGSAPPIRVVASVERGVSGGDVSGGLPRDARIADDTGKQVGDQERPSLSRPEYSRSKTTRMLQAIQRGEYAIAGFRNRDLRELLFGQASSAAEAK